MCWLKRKTWVWNMLLFHEGLMRHGTRRSIWELACNKKQRNCHCKFLVHVKRTNFVVLVCQTFEVVHARFGIRQINMTRMDVICCDNVAVESLVFPVLKVQARELCILNSWASGSHGTRSKWEFSEKEEKWTANSHLWQNLGIVRAENGLLQLYWGKVFWNLHSCDLCNVVQEQECKQTSEILGFNLFFF